MTRATVEDSDNDLGAGSSGDAAAATAAGTAPAPSSKWDRTARRSTATTLQPGATWMRRVLPCQR